MRKVFKFPVPITDVAYVAMPAGAEILDVRPQGPLGDLMLWALCDPEAPQEMRGLRIAGTGHAIEGGVRHISTFQSHGGTLVFHAFEILTTGETP